MSLIAALLLLTVACGGAAPKPGAETPAASPAATATPGVKPIPPGILASFYPEFASAQLTVKASLSVRTPSGVSTTLFNLTDYQLQGAVVSSIYGMMESLATMRPPLSFSADTDAQEFDVVVAPRRAAARFMILIPEGAPKPGSTTSDFIQTRDPPAVTSFDNNGNVFSFLELKPGPFPDGSFASVQQYATFNLAVETCQEVIQAAVYDSEGAAINDATLAQDSQEVLCNSLGAAVAAKALDWPFEQYLAFSDSHPIRITNGDASSVDLSQDDYESIQVTGTVVN